MARSITFSIAADRRIRETLGRIVENQDSYGALAETEPLLNELPRGTVIICRTERPRRPFGKFWMLVRAPNSRKFIRVRPAGFKIPPVSYMTSIASR